MVRSSLGLVTASGISLLIGTAGWACTLPCKTIAYQALVHVPTIIHALPMAAPVQCVPTIPVTQSVVTPVHVLPATTAIQASPQVLPVPSITSAQPATLPVPQVPPQAPANSGCKVAQSVVESLNRIDSNLNSITSSTDALTAMVRDSNSNFNQKFPTLKNPVKGKSGTVSSSGSPVGGQPETLPVPK